MHSSVTPIPIGLNEDSQLSPMTNARARESKEEKMLLNFKPDRRERIDLYKLLKDETYTVVERYAKRWQSAQALTRHYETISKYKWVLCPRGAGEDTHRLWEALYLGSIPVVLKSPLSSLHKGLPIIELDSWSTLSLSLLREKSTNISSDRAKAFMGYWKEKLSTEKKNLKIGEKV